MPDGSVCRSEDGDAGRNNPHNTNVLQSEGAQEYVRKYVTVKPSLRSSSRSTPTSTSTLRLREYFSKLSSTISSGGKTGHGENITPVKRKLIESKKVAATIPAFEPNLVDDLSPGENESESLDRPAKRYRVETGVKHPASRQHKLWR